MEHWKGKSDRFTFQVDWMDCFKTDSLYTTLTALKCYIILYQPAIYIIYCSLMLFMQGCSPNLHNKHEQRHLPLVFAISTITGNKNKPVNKTFSLIPRCLSPYEWALLLFICFFFIISEHLDWKCHLQWKIAIARWLLVTLKDMTLMQPFLYLYFFFSYLIFLSYNLFNNIDWQQLLHNSGKYTKQ